MFSPHRPFHSAVALHILPQKLVANMELHQRCLKDKSPCRALLNVKSWFLEWYLEVQDNINFYNPMTVGYFQHTCSHISGLRGPILGLWVQP